MVVLSRRLRMPIIELELLKEFLDVPDEKREVIIDTLEQLQPENPSENIEKLAKKLDINKEKIIKLIDFAISLYLNYYNYNKTVDHFLKNVVKPSIIESKIKIKIDKKLEDLIDRLLNMDNSIGIISKLTVLEKDNQFLLNNARVITDLRNAYRDQTNEITNYAIIMNTLKISFFQNNVLKELFISLDLKQLNDLKHVINRALEKNKFLTKASAEKGIKIIELAEVE